MYVLHNITIMITLAYTVTSENIYHKLFNQQASYLMLTNLPFSPHCILLVLVFFSHTFFLPSLCSSHFFPPPHVCSSSLEENLTVGCNAGCSCVRELYNPVCGADGMMYYSPCHAGCSSINHTVRSTGKQVLYTHGVRLDLL